MGNRRVVSWFSCGAASAVATKLAIQSAGTEVVAAYCDTFKREHPDNRRFFADCQRWFGQEILVLGNDEYERDTDVVFRKTRFLVGPKGGCPHDMGADLESGPVGCRLDLLPAGGGCVCAGLSAALRDLAEAKP